MLPDAAESTYEAWEIRPAVGSGDQRYGPSSGGAAALPGGPAASLVVAPNGDRIDPSRYGDAQHGPSST
jgi:hypothetical protein